MSNDLKRARLSFGNWNVKVRPRIYVNGNQRTTNYSVDYDSGLVLFTYAVSDYDQIFVDYNFKWFKDEELTTYLAQGINEVNMYPPQYPAYSVNNIPNSWFVAATYAAARNCLRQMMLSIQFQKPVKVFGSLSDRDSVFSHLDTLKKNYEDVFASLMEHKKNFPYAGLTRTITVPEYTLPGGRSRWFRYLFKGG